MSEYCHLSMPPNAVPPLLQLASKCTTIIVRLLHLSMHPDVLLSLLQFKSIFFYKFNFLMTGDIFLIEILI